MEKTPIELRNEKLGKRVVKALENRHFEAYYCADAAEACEKALSLIPEGSCVSWGGSDTIKKIGLKERVINGNFNVINRDNAKTPEERTAMQHQALGCDVFLMGSNAVTEDGQLVNIDRNGNRVGALVYGPKNVIIVAGMNKIVKNQAEAINRTRNVAAPINAQRFDIDTPCSITGSCADCTSASSICAQMVVTRLCYPAGRIKVILVGENLGF